jgi:DNA-binding transcriptional regulator LsrR (DeoR family)
MEHRAGSLRSQDPCETRARPPLRALRASYRGATVKTPLDERVMSIAPAGLIQVPRRAGVAGGASKYRAIQAALHGAWVNVLVTDLDTTRARAEDESSR